METKEIKFYNGIVFNNEDKFQFILPHKGEWFDFCPCEGINDYKSDKTCTCHVKIKDKGDHFLIITKPNFDHSDGNVSNWDDIYKRLTVEQLNKSEFWRYANEFNESRCIYKVGDTIIGEEGIMSMYGISLVTVICDSYQECDEILETLKL
jgi:hypothetical protein